jgi:hypothetical protein
MKPATTLHMSQTALFRLHAYMKTGVPNAEDSHIFKNNLQFLILWLFRSDGATCFGQTVPL